MVSITLDKFLTMVEEYANGSLEQPRPIIIWIDNLERELVRMDPHGDIVGFAGYLSSLYPTVSATYVPGSPLTGHKYYLTEKGVSRVSDELRYSLTIDENVIKYDNNGNLITRLYIHSPFSARLGENGLNSLEYGQILHKHLGIHVILMYPLEWKERFHVDMSDYDQFLCQGDKEDQLTQWFEDVETHNNSGLQVVDNFYLDFLKQCPKEYVSGGFESMKSKGATYSSYSRWEHVSDRLASTIHCVLFGMWTKADSNSRRILHSLFLDGNLSLHLLEEQLNKIENNIWSKRLEYLIVSEKIEPEYKRLSRIGIVMCHLCGLVTRENISSEVYAALWKFYKQKIEVGELELKIQAQY